MNETTIRRSSPVACVLVWCLLATSSALAQETDAEPLPDATEGAAPAEAGGGADEGGEGEAAEALPASEQSAGETGATDADIESLNDDALVEDVDVDALAGMELEELLDVEVVTATKTAQSASAAPAIVSVVTRRDIARWGYQSVGEALQHVVSFYLIDDHVIPNAGVRGVAGELFGESGTIKVMIDGHSVAFRSTGGNWLGPELVPLSAVERIEIIRGPSSALYGADAFLGVVNIITRTGEDVTGADARATAEWAEGRDSGLDFDMTAGVRRDNFDVLLSARFHQEDRSGLDLPKESPSPLIPEYRAGDLTSRGADGTSKVVFARARRYFGDNHTLSLVLRHAELDRGSEFSPWTQLPYGLDEEGRFHETRISLRQSSVGLIQEATLSDTAGIALRGYYFTGGPTGRDRIDVGSSLFEIQRKFGYEGLEGQIEARFSLSPTLSTVVGVETIVDRETLPSSLRVLKVATSEYEPGEVVEALSTRQDKELISNVGVFGQMSWNKLEPHLSMVGGVRYDQHSIYGGQLSGRFGAVSNPAKPLFIKALYGTAFLAPSPLLMFGVPHTLGDVVGNPDLKPQRVHTVEGQVSLRPNKHWALATGVSYSILLDKAAFIQQGVNRVARNLNEVRTVSWETEVFAEYDPGVNGYVTFELPHTVRESGEEGYQANLVGNENVIYPHFILRAGVSSLVPGLPLRPGVEVIAVGSRRASEMNILENGGSYSLDPYAMLDASLSTEGIEVLDGRETVFMIKGRNLLDARGPDPGFAGTDYPLLGRSVLAQMRQDF